MYVTVSWVQSSSLLQGDFILLTAWGAATCATVNAGGLDTNSSLQCTVTCAHTHVRASPSGFQPEECRSMENIPNNVWSG